jgi:hypothetical protein
MDTLEILVGTKLEYCPLVTEKMWKESDINKKLVNVCRQDVNLN